jgi:hypothetical protein
VRPLNLDVRPPGEGGNVVAIKTSTLLICLGGLIAATTVRWGHLRDGRTMKQIYQDARDGKLRSSRYSKFMSWVAVALIVTGLYLAVTWR